MQTKRRITRVQRAPRMYGDMHTVRAKRSARIALPWKPILGGSTAVYLIYLLFFSSVFTVKTVEVQGVALTSQDDYLAVVKKGQSIWTSQADAVQAVAAADRKVAQVSVLRGLPHTLRITVTENTPSAIWISQGKANLLTADGYVFAQYEEAELESNEALKGVVNGVSRVFDLAAVPVSVDEQLAGEPFITFVNSVRKELERMTPQYQVQKVEVNQSLFDVVMVLDQGVRLSLSTTADIGVQTRNFSRLVRDNAVAPGMDVDLRVDRWAYVSGP